MANISIFPHSGSSGRESVQLDTKLAYIEIKDAHGINLVSAKGELLVISERRGGGFDVQYRSHYSREDHGPEPTSFDAGLVQFENAVVRRPGEEGYDYGN